MSNRGFTWVGSRRTSGVGVGVEYFTGVAEMVSYFEMVGFICGMGELYMGLLDKFRNGLR